MAKKSMLQRELKRKNLVEKHSEKRKELLKKLTKVNSLDEIYNLNEQIQKTPRNSAKTRTKVIFMSA